jgi:hypothetical protein
MGKQDLLIASASTAIFSAPAADRTFTIGLDIFFKDACAALTHLHFLVIKINTLIGLHRLAPCEHEEKNKNKNDARQ